MIKKKPVGIKARYRANGFATTYGERDELIEELGFKNYRQYIDSELWQKIRQRVLNRDHWHCRFCGRGGSAVVHHIQYTKSNLSGRSLKHMVTVCPECHRKVEFARGKRKRPLIEAAQYGTKLERRGRLRHKLTLEILSRQ